MAYLNRKGVMVSKGWVILSPIIGGRAWWGVLKQRHVADFETYVLILYTALQNLLPARYFIPPIAKIGVLGQLVGVLVPAYFSSLCCGV